VFTQTLPVTTQQVQSVVLTETVVSATILPAPGATETLIYVAVIVVVIVILVAAFLLLRRR
ncbi:MAG: hypothetical protein LM581_05705, partial [Desulfurococcales archaeon]|nr:hypothetical protein [Desulfurococcales archaeon]